MNIFLIIIVLATTSILSLIVFKTQLYDMKITKRMVRENRGIVSTAATYYALLEYEPATIFLLDILICFSLTVLATGVILLII